MPEFWKRVLNIKENDKLKYGNLASVISVLLSIPASNAPVERTFSQLKRIKTDYRASMHNDTICAILHVKDYLKGFKQRNEDGSFGKLRYSSLAFSDALVKSVLAVQANRPINPGSRSKRLNQQVEELN